MTMTILSVDVGRMVVFTVLFLILWATMGALARGRRR